MRELTLVQDCRPLLAPPPARELEKCEGEVTAETGVTSETGDRGERECGESWGPGYPRKGLTDRCCCIRDSTSLMTSSVMSGGFSITVIKPVLRFRGESGEKDAVAGGPDTGLLSLAR